MAHHDPHHYQHRFIDGSECILPVGKVICVGRNYAAHARELGNDVPDAPILFMKPAASMVALSPSFRIPHDHGECHHETELSVLIGSTLQHASTADVQAAIAGYGLGLDLTLRDVQNELKQKGLPWEIAKAFDGANPLSPFVPAALFGNPDQCEFSLQINDEMRQRGRTTHMLHTLLPLIAHMSTYFTINPGDVIMTGTPEGVAALHSGDQLTLILDGTWSFDSQVQ